MGWTRGNDVGSRRLRALVLAVSACALAAVTVAPQASAAVTWAAPRLVDRAAPLGSAQPLTSVSCPVASFCAAVDPAGDVVTSTDPNAGAWSAPPSKIDVKPLTGVSCSSASLCVAVDTAGDAVSSVNPTGPPSAWSVATITTARPTKLDAVSCVPTFCVAVGGSRVHVSTTPSSGGWSQLIVDAGNSLVGVSCSSASLCVAVDRAGNVVTSTDPTGGAATWTVSPVDSPNHLNAVSCASSSLCVAVDTAGNAVTSTNPAGGSSAWAVANLPFAGFVPVAGISCAPPGPTSVCVATTGQGDVASTTDPTAGASAWTVRHVDASNSVIAVSCATAAQCVAVDSAGQAISSADPTGAATAWKVTAVDGSNQLTAVSCTNGSLCVGVDAQGHAVSSVDPTNPAVAWNAVEIEGGAPIALSGVACPTRFLCVAVDRAGNVYTSVNPTGPGTAWNPARVDPNGGGFTSVSCPSGSLCFAVDHNGHVLFSGNPTGGASAWTATTIDPNGGGLTGVSCPSASLCVAGDATGAVVTSTNPAGGGSAWSAAAIDPGAIITGVSCAGSPLGPLCVAVDALGKAISSPSPTAGAGAWTAAVIDPGGNLTGVSCPLITNCVAVDNAGRAFDTTAPAGGAGAWSMNVIDDSPAPSLTAVGCQAGVLCAAVDSAGKAVTGTGPSLLPPTEVAPPTIVGQALQGQVLSETRGSWTGQPSAFSYQWARCDSMGLNCAAIAGANRQTYRLITDDVGHTVRVLEAAANTAGSSDPAVSLPSGLVGGRPAAPAPLVAPTITGDLTDGSIVTVGTGVWSGFPSPAFEFQWQLCAGFCHAIDGARSASYRVTDADIGFKLRVVVIGVNATARVSGLSAIVGPVVVSHALHRRIQSALRRVLTPGGPGAHIGQLLRHRSYTFHIRAPIAGRLTITWYYQPPTHGRHRRVRPVLVAVARVNLRHQGRWRARVKLTSKGRRLLQHSRQLKLTARATLTLTGGVRETRIGVSRTITVKRQR